LICCRKFRILKRSSAEGVIITHRQVVATVAAAENALGVHSGEDVYLAYLPMAHILELMAEFCLFSMGCALCYADPKSLTTKGSYPEGALELYKPTMMVAVPKIWDVIKKGIEAKVAEGSAVKQYLVKTAFEWRGFCMSLGFDTPIFKALVFKKIAAATGGRLRYAEFLLYARALFLHYVSSSSRRYALSGGGPLNSEVHDFIRVAFGIVFVQGYGLTETNAGLTIQDHINVDMRGGVAGKPIPSVEVKVESTPDVLDKKGKPYLSTDRVDVSGNLVWGRGEICVRGPSVSSGYYTMPDQTAEVFKEDGWFLTGDIGQFLLDGSIQIVDRKKNLVKLKGGEYIALEKMEMTYGNSRFVDAVNGGICCVGDGEMDRPVALMQLNEQYVMKWAKDNGICGDFAKVKDSDELYKAVMADMKSEHAKSDLSHL
jgi:long-chain acyl-CoA synthetase